MKPYKKLMLSTLFIGCLINFSQCGKLLAVEKNCKDLRNCQLYFPCSFFYTGKFDDTKVLSCDGNKVFNEEKQECVEPLTKEELECLLESSIADIREPPPVSKKNEPYSPQFIVFTSPTTTTTTTTRATTRLAYINPRMNNAGKSKTLPPSNLLANSRSRLDGRVKVNYKDDNDENEKLFFEMLKSLNEEADNEEDEDDEDRSSIKGKKKNKKSRSKSPTSSKKNGLSKSKQMVRKQPPGGFGATGSDLSTEFDPDTESHKYKRMCIVTNWSQFRPSDGKFLFDFIDVNLCNHIIFSNIIVIEQENEDYEDEISFVLKPVQHNEFGTINSIHFLFKNFSN
jgi:hypothetical protein